jgi:branched-chain amino acid transport system ATP-binding protein
MLEVENIKSFYGQSQALFGMSLKVNAGEIVTLLGRNGMGKTTTVKSIVGQIGPKGGTIRFDGRVISGLPLYKAARLGIGLVPEGRQIFPNLSVRENLIATARPGVDGSSPWTFEKVIELFPRLGERLENMGNQLSGGEQQMLAVGRALMINPRLLILDEATEGLAPLIRDEIWNCLKLLKRKGQSILVIDKNLGHLIPLADRHYVVDKGHVVWSGSSEQLKNDEAIQAHYLGV